MPEILHSTFAQMTGSTASLRKGAPPTTQVLAATSGTVTSLDPPRQRNKAIDAARFICFVAVVLIHTIDAGHYFDPASPEALDPRLGLDTGQVLDQLSRFAVPFFFIASGYFMARRDLTSVSKALWAIIVRIGPVFIAWTTMYNLLDPVGRAHLGDPGFWLRLVTQGGVMPHLWFLPSLLACLGLLVVSNRFLSARGQFVLAAALYGLGLVFGAYFDIIFGHTPSMLQLHLVRDAATAGFIFVVTGYWLARSQWQPSFAAALAILAFGCVWHMSEAWMFVALQRHALHNNEYLAGTVPFGIGVFLVALAWPKHWAVSPTLALLGYYGLGLYLIHPLFINILTPMIESERLATRFLIAILTVLLSSIAVIGLARVAPLRRFVA